LASYWIMCPVLYPDSDIFHLCVTLLETHEGRWNTKVRNFLSTGKQQFRSLRRKWSYLVIFSNKYVIRNVPRYSSLNYVHMIKRWKNLTHYVSTHGCKSTNTSCYSTVILLHKTCYLKSTVYKSQLHRHNIKVRPLVKIHNGRLRLLIEQSVTLIEQLHYFLFVISIQ